VKGFLPDISIKDWYEVKISKLQPTYFESMKITVAVEEYKLNAATPKAKKNNSKENEISYHNSASRNSFRHQLAPIHLTPLEAKGVPGHDPGLEKKYPFHTLKRAESSDGSKATVASIGKKGNEIHSSTSSPSTTFYNQSPHDDSTYPLNDAMLVQSVTDHDACQVCAMSFGKFNSVYDVEEHVSNCSRTKEVIKKFEKSDEVLRAVKFHFRQLNKIICF